MPACTLTAGRPESLLRRDGARGEAAGFCTGRGRLCSAVAELLAQRYTAESSGSVGWIFRVENDSLGI